MRTHVTPGHGELDGGYDGQTDRGSRAGSWNGNGPERVRHDGRRCQLDLGLGQLAVFGRRDGVASSGGRAPAFTGALRRHVEKVLPRNLEEILQIIA